MGLIEQIKSGSVFSRGTVTLTNSPATGNTTEFGSTYILLSVSATAPCRVRLYGNEHSVAIDASRPTSSFDYSASVALNLDAGLTAGNLSLTFNPPIIATTRVGSVITYYNIESATTPTTVTLGYYPIEFDTTSRTYLNIPVVSLAANQTSSGNITSPKSFLIRDAVANKENLRLRLYSRPIEDVSSTEKNRPFLSQSLDGSHLIADLLYDSASYIYQVSPVLQAYNLESYLSGSNRVGYILQNTAAVTQTSISTAVGIYPIED